MGGHLAHLVLSRACRGGIPPLASRLHNLLAEHKLWGFDPVGYHVVNVLLQLANSLILWRILVRLSIPGAWLIAAVFAVHPVHADSVTWVIERKDVLSGLFYLTAFLAWLRFEQTREQRPYLLALTLFTAGLLSKSIVVTLPAALLVLAWWKHGRLTQADFTRTAPFFAVGLVVTARLFGIERR